MVKKLSSAITLDRMIKIGFYLAAIWTGFGIDTELKFLADLVFLFSIPFALISLLLFRRGGWSEMQGLFSFPVILVFLFATGSTSLNLSYPRTIDIGDQRLFLKSIFFLFVTGSLVIFYFRKISGSLLSLLGFLLFSSFPFVSLSLAGNSLTAIVATGLTYAHRKSSRDIPAGVIFFTFPFILIFSFEYIFFAFQFDGASDTARLIASVNTTFFIILLMQKESFNKIIFIISMICLLTLSFFLLGIRATMMMNPAFIPLLSKSTYLAGINTNDMGGTGILLFGLGLGLFLSFNRWWTKTIGILPVIVPAIVILISWSRSAFPVLLLIPAVLLSGVYVLRENLFPENFRRSSLIWLERWNWFFFLVLVVIGLVALLSARDQLQTDSLDIRQIYWEFTLKRITDHPLLGCGPGCNEMIYSVPAGELKDPENISSLIRRPFRGSISHSHNTLFQIWLELGIFGAILFYGISIRAILKGLFSNPYPQDPGIRLIRSGVAMGVMGLLIHGLTNYVLFHPAISILYFTFLGVILYEPGEKKEPDESPTGWRRVYDFLPAHGISVIAVMILLFSFHNGAALYFRSRLIQNLLPHLYLNDLQTFVLYPTDRTPTIRNMDLNRKTIDHSIASGEWGLFLYPSASDLETLMGDLHFAKFTKTKKPTDFAESVRWYDACATDAPIPAYCLQRKSDLLLKGKMPDTFLLFPPDPKSPYGLYLTAGKRDPFNLHGRKNVKAY